MCSILIKYNILYKVNYNFLFDLVSSVESIAKNIQLKIRCERKYRTILILFVYFSTYIS